MKPLSPTMANAMRRMRDAAPKFVLAGSIITMNTRRALVARGLSREGYILSGYGMMVARALGDVPTDPWGKRLHDDAFCPACERYVPPDLIAWDQYDGAPDANDPPCITCHLEVRNASPPRT